VKKTQKKIQRKRERHNQRVMARFVAELIGLVKDSPTPPLRSDDSAQDVQRDILISCLLAMLREVGPNFLRLVADAMDGKLSPKLTDAVREAYGKGCNRNSGDRGELFTEIENALPVILTQMGFKANAHKESVRHCLKVLAYPMPKTGRGRPKKISPKIIQSILPKKD
jgi:hypothetical protein